jgi:hypothetical protein
LIEDAGKIEARGFEPPTRWSQSKEQLLASGITCEMWTTPWASIATVTLAKTSRLALHLGNIVPGVLAPVLAKSNYFSMA